MPASNPKWVVLTFALGLALGAGPDCKVTVDHRPIGTSMATNRQHHPAPVASTSITAGAAAPVTRIRVHGRVWEAKLVKRILPKYPKSACEGRVAGTVHLLVTIAKDGSIRRTEVVEGDPRLSPAAELAVKQWQYRPTHINGNRVEVETNIYIQFLISPQQPGR